LKRGQDRFRGAFPGGGKWGGKGILLVVIVLVLVWLATGVYRVEQTEQGVVLRFGKYAYTTQPGLRYHLPAPIETALTPQVTIVNQVNIGFQSVGEFGRATGLRDIPAESLMLTGDENIVDVDVAVFWKIGERPGDTRNYLFNIQNPQSTVKAVAESIIREVVGNSRIDDVLTEGRERVELEAYERMQETLDNYGAGIRITQVKLQKADPPAAVIDSFRDVQAARADQERSVNEAQAYANDIIPRARGEAEQIRLDAEGYREQTVAEAEGEVSRYLAIYNEYRQAKDVTRKRLYLETLEEVFGGMNKVVIDSDKGPGVVPYLPLPEIQKRAVQNRPQGASQ
jgi:membrane protease subunit HflK